jgi:hypothetical protein
MSFCCFHFPPKPYSESIKISKEKTVVLEFNNESKLFEWIGILFLALAVWTWRKELKLTGVGPLSGQPLVEQREAKEVELEMKEDEQIQDIEISALRGFKKDQSEKRKKRILELAEKHRAIDKLIVSRDLQITSHVAETYLYLLTKEGKLRQDGFPRSIFTLTNSIENRAIDKIKSILEIKGDIIFERRFVKVQRKYDIDALLKNNDQTFLIEIKYMRSQFSNRILNIAYTQLIDAAKELKEKNLELYLIIVTPTKVLKNKIKKVVENYTFDSKVYPFIIVALAEEDL